MNRSDKVRTCRIVLLLLLATLVVYRGYLLIYEKDYRAVNAENINKIVTRLHGSNRYRFVVAGNIQNSMRLFEKRIIPLIQDNDADFMISLGNSVSDGSEDKYHLLHRGFRKLGIPYLMTFGDGEMEDFGSNRYYRHFGPYLYSFSLDNAYFIFLDSTGKTNWKWQLYWLKNELTAAQKYPHRFVFMNQSPLAIQVSESVESSGVLKTELCQSLQTIFSQYRVTAVFSSGYPIYNDSVLQGVRYIVSGGGGGLLLNHQMPYQIAEVAVSEGQFSIGNLVAIGRMGTFLEKLEIFKLYLHSFFYKNSFNLLLALITISLVLLQLHASVLQKEYLYRDFSDDKEILASRKLRVAMFTNNYLPFIGGVPLSIARLCRGLGQFGTVVKVFAPTYPNAAEELEESNVFRCPTLFRDRLTGFSVANVFSRKITAAFHASKYDLIHVHHPFWLGKKGMQIAKKNGTPLVFSYHTRLERYIHYLPFPGGTALKNLTAHFLIKRFANRCDAIITPTLSTEEYLRNLGVSVIIENIPSGFNAKNYSGWKPQQIKDLRNQYAAVDEPLLISVSRMAKEKNLHFLIDGLAELKKQISTPFKCLLLGDGPEKNRLEDKVDALGLNTNVIFTGSLPHGKVAAYYLAADLFVFASTSETQGMVLIEAMAGACPVVAVRSSGVNDVLKDGYNGVLVAEDTESWAEAVAGLLTDRQRLLLLAENSRAFAASYTEEKVAENVLKFYRRVIALHEAKQR